MSTPRPDRPTPRQRHQGRQRGVYAIEFGMVFMVFFAVLYAVLCYGILFTVRLGMQNAAEEGARAGLRYQASWTLRLREAERETNLRLSWMKYPPAATAQLCQLTPSTVCSSGAATPAQCAIALDQLCQIVVTVSYAPYANRAQQWLPPLPAPLLPGSSASQANTFMLIGQASMLLDGKVL